MLAVEFCITAALLLTLMGFCASSSQRFPPALHPLTLWRSTRMECSWFGNLWKPTPLSTTLSSAGLKVKVLSLCFARNTLVCRISSPAGYFSNNEIIVIQKQPDLTPQFKVRNGFHTTII